MDLARYRNIAVLTGAGISHSAGLPTYRGTGGLWTDPRLAALSDVNALVADRAAVCDLFWSFRRAIEAVQPTPAHAALAAFEQRLPRGTRFQIITQNIDGLHQRAGSNNVCELHGSLRRWRCDRCTTELEPADGEAPVHCDQRMRPAVVLFGEAIPVDAERTVKQALRDCDLFVAIAPRARSSRPRASCAGPSSAARGACCSTSSLRRSTRAVHRVPRRPRRRARAAVVRGARRGVASRQSGAMSEYRVRAAVWPRRS